ncbi:MAG: BACON domain-containing protein, partial [Bacteroidales bacterium]|nr:BACON domain-containing protein [Bacteroidales bacterium]
MKNIFRIFAAMVAGVVLFASCLNEAAPLASSVSVDKTAVSAEGAGAAPITVKVTADGDWFALTSAEWISVEPANGGQGVTEVSIKVADNVDKYNELNGPRSGSVSFCYGTAGVATTEISQKGENGLDASRTY